MEKLFLIDAYAIIYRSYYAFIKNPRINSKGENTSAVLGFVNTLHEVITKEKPTHIAVAFDHGKTFREEVYPQYKAQREETPEDIRRSVPIIKDILDAFHIPAIIADGFEADDIIGTIASKAGAEGIDTFMLTPDKDYGQLVTEKVRIFRPRHGGGYETLGPAEVCEKYGITTPLQVIDILALMGDSADNFPGCPGVGPKTATQLIAQFNSVEELLERTNEVKGKMREKIEAAVDDIRMSKFLATIRTDVPVEFNLHSMRSQEPDEEKLRKIFADLEFKALADKILKKSKTTPKTVNTEGFIFAEFATEGQEEEKYASFETVKTVAHSYILADNQEIRHEIVKEAESAKSFVLDTETTSLVAIDAELVGISISVRPHEAYYIPFPPEREKAMEILEELRPLLENEEIEKGGQNMKYDIRVLMNYGIALRGPMFDTMIAHYLWRPELAHNMDFMAESLLHYECIHIEELIGPKGKQQRSMRNLKPEQVLDYAAEDADVTLQLKHILKEKLIEDGLLQLFEEVEMPLVSVLADMEHTGVRIDSTALRETSTIFNARAAEIEKEIYLLAGHSFNIASPRQVGEVLFSEMKITDKPKKTKTGQFVTSEEELQKYATSNEIVQKILDYRGLKKLIGTYVDALPQLVNPRTGHIHTSFNQAVTATGRLSSSDPNLQNIPIRDEDGKEIRRCFVPEEGCQFFSADYSQIELRVMAHLSADEAMVEAFNNSQDIHAATAATVYSKPRETVTREERTKAKRANFGLIYGISVWGLQQGLNIEREEARKLMAGFFATFPKVEQYMEQSKERVRQTGYATTLLHRRRYLPDITSANATVRGFAERNAINAPIQGSAADIIKIAMVRIFKRFKEEGLRSKMILQVHDELNFSVFPDEHDCVETIVLEEMQNAVPLAVPLVADSGWGKNWLEAH